MRFLLYGVLLSVFALVARASQWSSEDYEIFRLNDEIKKDLGEAINLYSWFDLPNGPKSTLKQIQKAIRQKSRELHPDKLGNVAPKLKKAAEARYQRLSVAGNIIRDASSKKRYDFFLNKGFPKLKGSSYLYSRFRPGLLFTLVMLYLIISALHYVAMKINRREEHKRVANFRATIKKQAWGGSLLPPTDGSDRKVSVEGSDRTFVVKPTGKVYFEDDEVKGGLHLFDECQINLEPGFKESLIYLAPCWAYNQTLGRATGKIIDTSIDFEYEDSDDNSSDEKDGPKKSKKKIQRGEKVLLPNGKVVYGRSSGSKRK